MTLRKGDILGELEFLDPSSPLRKSDVISSTSSIIGIFSYSDLRELSIWAVELYAKLLQLVAMSAVRKMRESAQATNEKMNGGGGRGEGVVANAASTASVSLPSLSSSSSSSPSILHPSSPPPSTSSLLHHRLIDSSRPTSTSPRKNGVVGRVMKRMMHSETSVEEGWLLGREEEVVMDSPNSATTSIPSAATKADYFLSLFTS